MNNREKVDEIFMAVNTVTKTYQKWCKKLGIEYYDMILYYALIENGNEPMTQKQICDELDIPKTTVNSIIKKQNKLGYLQLETNPDNRKEKFIILTSKGKKYARELIEPLFKIEEDSISLLSDKQIEEIINSLTIYTTSLKNNLEI